MNKLFSALAVITATLGLTLIVHGEDSEPGPKGQVTIVEDKNNVVASELYGTWTVEKELCKRLCGEDKSIDLTEFTFTKSDEAKTRMSEFVNEAMKERGDQEGYDEYTESLRRVYLCGEVSIRYKGQDIVGDFFLINLFGNPHVLFSDREGDIESFNLAIARDEEGDQDLLFVGGDFNNQSFMAFERKEVSKDEASEKKTEK